MDKQNDGQGQAVVTDDQELAKVLAGMNQDAEQIAPTTDGAGQTTADLQFEETPASADETPVPETDPQPVVAALPTILPSPSTDLSPSTVATASPELESIKKTALEELRPLIDKLNLPPEEKFDTLLLIIRSTDDQSLVGATHDAAKAIEDETKRAQALLDVIKEIDYFANQPK